MISLRSKNTLAPTKASPARSVIVPDFTSVTGNLGFTAAGLTRWKGLLANLLAQRADAFVPAAFNQKPLVPPTLGFGILLGSMTQESYVQLGSGKVRVSMEISVEGGISDGINEQLFVGAMDSGSDNVPAISSDPDEMLTMLSPWLSKLMDGILAKIVKNSNYNNFPWQSVVQQVDGDTVAIKGSQADNLQPGNLLTVSRLLQSNPVIYEGIAAIQVVSVPASISDFTQCTYHGVPKSAAQAGDAVFIGDLHHLELDSQSMRGGIDMNSDSSPPPLSPPQLCHGEAIEYRAYARVLFPDSGAAVLCVLANCYYPHTNFTIFFDDSNGLTLMEQLGSGHFSYLVTSCGAGWSSRFAASIPSEITIKDGNGVHTIPVVPW